MTYPKPSKEPLPYGSLQAGCYAEILGRPSTRAAFKEAVAPSKCFTPSGLIKGGWAHIARSGLYLATTFIALIAAYVIISAMKNGYPSLPTMAQLNLWFFGSSVFALVCAGAGKLKIRGWLVAIAILTAVYVIIWLAQPLAFDLMRSWWFPPESLDLSDLVFDGIA